MKDNAAQKNNDTDKKNLRSDGGSYVSHSSNPDSSTRIPKNRIETRGSVKKSNSRMKDELLATSSGGNNNNNMENVKQNLLGPSDISAIKPVEKNPAVNHKGMECPKKEASKHQVHSHPHKKLKATGLSKLETISTETMTRRRTRSRVTNESDATNNQDETFIGQQTNVTKKSVAERPSTAFENIDLNATILSRMDRDSYERCILQDSNKILEKVLLPSNFPWAQPLVSIVKNITRDIDELPAIMKQEDELFAPFQNGPFNYGKFEVGVDVSSIMDEPSNTIHRKPKKINETRFGARRAEDPGIIELTTMKPVNQSLTNSISNTNSKVVNTFMDFADESSVVGGQRKKVNIATNNQGDINATCDVASLYFRQQLVFKQEKVDIATNSISRKTFSVRVGSVTSRSSIFTSKVVSSEQIDGDVVELYDYPRTKIKRQVPLLCEALLPVEVQTGKSVTVDEAVQMDIAHSTNFDSYDARYGTDYHELDNRHRSKRVYVGRNRRVWTCRNEISSTATRGATCGNRFVYNDVLTGTQINDLSYKRPRDVLVGIRVNGMLLTREVVENSTSSNSIYEEMLDQGDSSDDEEKSTRAKKDVMLSPSDEIVDVSIGAACAGVEAKSYSCNTASGRSTRRNLKRPCENGLCRLNSIDSMKTTSQRRKKCCTRKKQSVLLGLPVQNDASATPLAVAEF